MANRNTDAIQGFKVPTTQTELRSFLGLRIVYRRFIPNFVRVAATLTELLRKERGRSVPQLSESQLAAFGLLKKALVLIPVLDCLERACGTP